MPRVVHSDKKGNTMIKSILAAGCSLTAMVLVPFAGMALTPTTAHAEVQTLGSWTYQAPKLSCEEDMPCWRVWMGDAEFSPEAPLYMFMPEGHNWDQLAPLFGYDADA